jgi:putative endonuclease
LVEHHLAKVDVASSSLVTRSSLRLKRSAIEGWSERAVPWAKVGRLNPRSYGWQASLVMYYAYLLKSKSSPNNQYIGARSAIYAVGLKRHNKDRSPHTAKFRPWLLIAYFGFADEKTAIEFEKYLKWRSGHAFINRHFV